MKKYILGAAAVVVMALAAAVPAMAAKPAMPGCFGADRAAYIHNVAQTDATSPGASEVGQILSDRAGTNGTINQDYKTSCGGDPVNG